MAKSTVSNKLVIVESPAKARTIGKMLGPEYVIHASMGHVRDLPEHAFGVDIKNHFQPLYQINKDREKVIKQIQSAAKKADSIYLAPDPDREGEAIAWHLKEILQENTKAPFYRVTFHEITRSAIDRAFQNTGDIDLHRVDSQQARRILDRVVGYQISPLLWSQIEKGISAGRVQSVALRLVVEREREIQAFKTEEYWNFIVKIAPERLGKENSFESRLVRINGEKFAVNNATDAASVLDRIKHSDPFRVVAIKKQPKQRHAAPPFITSTMQQAASSTMGFAASRTMRIAQQLYEGIDIGSGGPVGLITYMRTDSVAVAKEAQSACRHFIAGEVGNDYVPPTPNIYRSKSNAQEAHEAIRPTDVFLTPEKARPFLDDPQYKLYSLVWRRFVASQMAPARQEQTTIESVSKTADGQSFTFRTTATVTTFPGFLKFYRIQDKEEDEEIPPVLAELKEGELCRLLEAGNEQKFTEPPPRFSEASLIRELELNGIGRPSTYATIVNTIQDREYVLKESGRLHPSDLGYRVNDFLVTTLPELFQVGFTAEMETELDQVEAGQLRWVDMLQHFYDKFSVWLNAAKAIGAPSTDKASALIRTLSGIAAWAPAEKRGKRTYDDHKFFTSVEEQFANDKQITAKQWQALLKMAINYRAQLPGLDALAAEHGFTDELNAHAEQQSEAKRREEENALDSTAAADYEKLFGVLSQVKWKAPEKNSRGRVYDDKKFFESLKKQAESGRRLSDRQMEALAKMAAKYKEQIPDFAALAPLLKINPAAVGGAGDAASPAAAGGPDSPAAVLLRQFDGFTAWAEPVKKGPRLYDDKNFFESLQKQHHDGRQLSDRQIAALKKIAAKYHRLPPAAPETPSSAE